MLYSSRIGLLGGLAFLLVSAPDASAQQEAFDSCGFSIDFPTPPVAQADSVEVDGGRYLSWNLTSQAGSQVFMVICRPSPDGFSDEQRESVFEAALAPSQGEVIRHREIRKDGHPGIESDIQSRPGWPYIYTRTYVTDRAVVVVLSGDSAGEVGAEPKESKRFQNSLRLVSVESAD